MRKQQHTTRDNNLIWESFTKQQPSINTELDKLLKEDYRYIEDFLVAEGLADKVKGAWGSVKNFANEKLVQPLINLIVQAIQKDPTLAQKTTQALEQGDVAFRRFVDDHADPSVAAQMGSSVTGESYDRQLELNEIIIEALLREGIVDYTYSVVIKERYFDSICQNLLTECTQTPGECPWMPAGAIPVEENASAVKQIVDVINNARSSDPHFRPGRMFDMLQSKYPAFAKYVQTKGQAAAADSTEGSTMKKPGKGQMALTHGGQRHIVNKPQSKPAPEQGQERAPEKTPVETGDYTPPDSVVDDTRGSSEAPPEATEEPTEKPGATGSYTPPDNYPGTAPTAQAPSGGGMLNKLWGFAKQNKGIMTGAAALGLLGVLTTIPAVAPIAIPALKTALISGGIGTGIGTAKAKGSMGDRIRQGLNAGGYASAIGGAVGAAAAPGAGVGSGETAATPTAEPVDASSSADGGMNADGTSTADITDADVESQYTDAMLDGDDGALADGSISDAEAAEINAGLDGNQPTSPNNATASVEPPQAETNPPTPETDGSTNYTELQEPTRPDATNTASTPVAEPTSNPTQNMSDAQAQAEYEADAREADAAEAEMDQRTTDALDGFGDFGDSGDVDAETKAKWDQAHKAMDTDGNGILDNDETGDKKTFLKRFADYYSSK